jgi:hypothetical protein
LPRIAAATVRLIRFPALVNPGSLDSSIKTFRHPLLLALGLLLASTGTGANAKVDFRAAPQHVDPPRGNRDGNAASLTRRRTAGNIPRIHPVPS